MSVTSLVPSEAHWDYEGGKDGNISNSNNEKKEKLEKKFSYLLEAKVDAEKDEKSSRKVIKCWKILFLFFCANKENGKTIHSFFSLKLWLVCFRILKNENIRRYSNVFDFAERRKEKFSPRTKKILSLIFPATSKVNNFFLRDAVLQLFLLDFNKFFLNVDWNQISIFFRFEFSFSCFTWNRFHAIIKVLLR